MARSMLLLLSALAGLAGCGGAETALSPARAPAEPAGTIVYLSAPNRLVAIDVASGRRTARRMRSLAACGPQMFVTGGRLVFAGVTRSRTTVFSLPLSLEGPPTRLGEAHAFVPSTTDGRVWLAGVDCDRRTMRGVREVTVGGRTTFSSPRRAPGSWLPGAVESGLVVQVGRGNVIWDPRSGATVRPLGLEAVSAAHGTLLAGCAEASRCRTLAVRDGRTGRTVVVRRNGFDLDAWAKFSPDGAVLATPARAGRRWHVALVDPQDGTTTLVPGLRTREFPELTWSRSSGWLLIRAGVRVFAYRPGLSPATVLRFRVPRRAVGLVAG